MYVEVKEGHDLLIILGSPKGSETVWGIKYIFFTFTLYLIQNSALPIVL